MGLFAIYLITSCNKDVTNLPENNQQSIELPTVNVNNVIKGFSSDMAIFSSRNEFAAFLLEFNKLNEENQKILLNNIEYETVQDILDAAYAGMDSIQTREEFIEYLSQYSDYLELVTLPNGEEQVVEKGVTGHSIYPFLNSAQIVKVGNVYQKYFSKLCVESENLDLLKQIKNEDDVKNSRLKYFVAYTDNPNEIQNESEINYRWGELGKIYTWEKQNDAYWCKNKRKAELKVGFDFGVNELYDPRFGTVHQVIVKRKGEIIAWRKGIPCIWYRYKTTITWNGFYTDYDVDKTGVKTYEIWQHADEQKYASSIDRSGDYYVYYLEFNQYFDCQWNKIKSKITTTGLGGEWMLVDYPN